MTTVKRSRIHSIALTVEYFRVHGYYECLVISTGSYWSSEELEKLAGGPGSQRMETVNAHSQVVSEKLYNAALH